MFQERTTKGIQSNIGNCGAVRTWLRSCVFFALGLACASSHSQTISAQACELTPGYIIAYYFNAGGTILAAEGMFADPRKPKPLMRNDPFGDFWRNQKTELADELANGKPVDIIDKGAKFAIYATMSTEFYSPMNVICVEDLSSIRSRIIGTAVKDPSGLGACNCPLVWCGKFKCCPC